MTITWICNQKRFKLNIKRVWDPHFFTKRKDRMSVFLHAFELLKAWESLLGPSRGWIVNLVWTEETYTMLFEFGNFDVFFMIFMWLFEVFFFVFIGNGFFCLHFGLVFIGCSGERKWHESTINYGFERRNQKIWKVGILIIFLPFLNFEWTWTGCGWSFARIWDSSH